MKSKDKLVSTSKFLSLVLRHRPEVIEAKLDHEGWLAIDELIAQANAHGKAITLQL
ncbi:RNA 2'-phosphotransferase, partial [Rhodopirellula sp. JC639]|uniref:RNA 2'-phosphotransferase n=1 Tax=Stieleria mannarensis TaxID=2755585 RepID=UPI001602C0B2